MPSPIAGVDPVRTWVYNSDEPVVLRIHSRVDYDVRIYIDSIDPNNLVKEMHLNRGVAEYELFEAGTLTPNELHHIIITDTHDIPIYKPIPVLYEKANLRNSAQIYVVDENQAEIYGRIILLDKENEVVRILDGSNFRVIVKPNVSMEIIAGRDDKKYYAIVWEVAEKFEAGKSYTLKLEPAPEYILMARYKIDFSDDYQNKILATLSTFFGEVASWIAEKGIDIFGRAPELAARTVNKISGIKLPVIKVDAKREGTVLYIDVYYKQDIVSVLLMILANLARVLPFIITIVLVGKILVQPITNAFQAYVNTVQSRLKLQEKRLQTNEKIMDACEEYKDRPDLYFKCINGWRSVIDMSYISEDSEVADVEAVGSASLLSKYDELKKLVYLGGAALVGAMAFSIAAPGIKALIQPPRA